MREIGDEFEKKVANLLDLKRTAKSGGHWDNGDLESKSYIIECKVKNTAEWFQPNKTEIKKLMKQAKKHGKDWIYIQKNNAGEFALLSLDTLASLLQGYHQNEDSLYEQ